MLRGFNLLDADHHALHALIDRFVADANAVLTAKDDPARHEAVRRFTDDLAAFDRLLTRHLTDEEDLVLPARMCGRSRMYAGGARGRGLGWRSGG